MQLVEWNHSLSYWVTTDDRHPGLTGRGRTKEESRADLAMAIEREAMERIEEWEVPQITPIMPSDAWSRRFG